MKCIAFINNSPSPPRGVGAWRGGGEKRCNFDRAYALSYVMSPFQGYTPKELSSEVVVHNRLGLHA